MRWLVGLAAAVCLSGCATGGPPESITGTSPVLAGAQECGDVLAAIGRKPAGLAFIGCVHEPEWQGRPLVSTYRVDGAGAAAVEDRLVEAVGLKRLHRSCCQWDAPPHYFTDEAGRLHRIVMVSDESGVRDRAGWSAIPTFEVVVDSFTEEI